MTKQFVGNYRTACRYVNAMAKYLAAAWPTMANGYPASRREYVVQAVHHVQPRKKSVYLALLVHRELMVIDRVAAAAFIMAMEPKDRRKKCE